MDTPKQIVTEAYNNPSVSSWYSQWALKQAQHSPRERLAQTVLDNCTSTPPEILDMGCGPGIPVLPYLLERGARVVANDISQQQLDLARKNCGSTEGEVAFVLGDMASLEFEKERFDGVVSFYTLFHLPRSELELFLRKVFAWMKPSGVFVFNLAVFDEEEVFGEVLGRGMFWSSFGEKEGLDVVRRAGFEVLSLEKGEGSEEADEGAEFLWVVGRKPTTSA